MDHRGLKTEQQTLCRRLNDGKRGQKNSWGSLQKKKLQDENGWEKKKGWEILTTEKVGSWGGGNWKKGPAIRRIRENTNNVGY